MCVCARSVHNNKLKNIIDIEWFMRCERDFRLYSSTAVVDQCSLICSLARSTSDVKCWWAFCASDIDYGYEIVFTKCNRVIKCGTK